MRPKRAQPLAHDGVVAFETQPAQLLMQPHGGQVRIAFQQLCDLIRERVQQARPAEAFLVRGPRTAILMIRQHAAYAFAVDSPTGVQSGAARRLHNAAGRSRCVWTPSSLFQFADEVLA